MKALRLSLLCCACLASAASFSVGTWKRLQNSPPAGIGLTMLLTDGTVMAHNPLTREWYKLKPDISGSYQKGTWSRLADLPTGYGPLYYASAVLANGRVVVIGGEYNLTGGGVWTNLGAWYDPKTNVWTPLPAPNGWANVGDAQCSVMPDGKFLLAMPFDTRMAILDPNTMTWKNLAGAGKADRFDEEGWTLLPDGTILTTDALNAPNAERYLPTLDRWIPAGACPQSLEDINSQEIGPSVLMPDGTVFCTGATGHNAVYHPGTNLMDPGTWTAAPDFPNIGGQLDIADGPAILLTNGNVLCNTSPGVFNTPTHLFEYDGTQMLPVPEVPNAPFNSSYVGNFLMLPTGEVLFTDFSDDVELYTSSGAPQAAWKPKITSFPATMANGSSYVVSGTQFNGLSQCSVYGDDSSAATNYPIARFTKVSNGHVMYAKTINHSTMAVATGTKVVNTTVQIPSNAEVGTYKFEIIANGIPSNQVQVTINPNDSAPTSVSKFEGATSSGGLTQILNSDNTYFGVTSVSVLRTGQVASAMVEFPSPGTGVAGLQINYESSAATGVSAFCFLYNWTTNSWVSFNASAQSATDKTTTVTVNGPVSQYISSTGKVRVLIRGVRPGTLTSSPAPYTLKLDKVGLAAL